MGKIEGWIGTPDKFVSVLTIGVEAFNPKKDKTVKTVYEYAAIERFKQSDGTYIYIKTAISEKDALDPSLARDYLNKNRRTRGEYCTVSEWEQGVKHSRSKRGYKDARTLRETHEYSSEICGDLHKKSDKRIKRIIRLSGEANKEFMDDLLVGLL